MKLGEIAVALGLPLSGDGEVEVESFAPLALAGAGEISFVTDAKAAQSLNSCKAVALVIPAGTKPDRPSIIAENPLLAFAGVMELLSPEPRFKPGIDPTASMGADADIGDGVFIGPHVTVGDGATIGENAVLMAGVSVGSKCSIGNRSVIFPNVTLYDGTCVGENCRIHAGAVIGSDGFGYVKADSGDHRKIPQRGAVRIEDNVEIGALCAIDRATMGETVIKKGAKLDNHVHIGHNTVIGENTVIAGCCGIAGSVTIGANVMIGGMAAVADHVTIVSGTVIAGKTGVHSDITEPGVYSGHLAMKNMKFKRFLLSGQRIDSLSRKVKELEKKISAKGEKK